jgi:ABC-type transport system involved in multi-copper enzyme maturation permease subunit
MSSVAAKSSSDNRLRQSLIKTWLIAQKEIITNIQNYRIYTAFGSLTLLFLLSTHLLAIDYKQRLENWRANQAALQNPVVGEVVKYELHNGNFFYSVGAAPDPPAVHPQPLSALVLGMDREVDRVVTVTQRIGFGPREDENAMSALFDAPDILFGVKLLVSLLALFFSVDAVTREKESGTLRAIMSNPVRRHEFAIGKVAGAFLSLLLPLASAFFIGVAYLCLAHDLLTGKDELTRVILIFIVVLLYSLVFTFLGFFVSTITARTKTAMVVALLGWGFLVLVLPNAGVLAAKILSPAPSYNQLNARLYESERQIIQAELRAHPGARSIFEIANSKQVIMRIYEIDKQLTDDYITNKQNEITQARRLALLSPAGALSFGVSDLAGTGATAYRSYLESLSANRDILVDALIRQWDLPPSSGNKIYAEAVKDIASRQRQSELLGASARAAGDAIVSLIVWALLLGAAFYWRLRNYDVR